MLTPLALQNAPILRAVRAQPFPSIAELARSIGRDKSNVRVSVGRLTTEGLVMGGDAFRLTDAGAEAVAALDRADGKVDATSPVAGFVDLRHDEIDPDPNNARTVFDAEELFNLANSIADRGMQSKPAVRRIGDRHRLVFGERRWRAWGLLIAEGRWPADRTERLELRVSDDEAAVIEAGLIENEQRVDLNHVDRARIYERLAGLDRDNATIARLAGRTVEYIQQHRRLLRLDEDTLAMVADRRLTFHEALRLIPTTRKAKAPAPVDQPLPIGGDVAPAKPHHELTEVERFMAGLPEDQKGRLDRAAEAMTAFNEAILAGDEQAMTSAHAAFTAVVYALNGGVHFGSANVRAALAADLATPRGEAPEWGRPGEFLVEIGGVRMTVEVDGLGIAIGVCGGFEINAVDPNAPFPSETGYRSFSGLDPVSVPLLECIVRTVARNMADRDGAPTAIVGEAAKARAAERGAAFADLEPVAYPAEWADAFRSTGPNVIGRSAPKANPFPDGLYLQDGEFIPDKPASRRAATSFIGDDFSRQLRDSAAIDEDEDAIATAEAEAEAAAEIGGMIASGLFAEWKLDAATAIATEPPLIILTLKLTPAQAGALVEVVRRTNVAA